MHVAKNILLLFLAFLLTRGCDQSRFNFDVVIIPREVTNFSEVNSIYDDYNSVAPLNFTSDGFSLVFSSNRNSNGGNFDLVSYQCHIFSNQVNASFDIWSDPMDYPFIANVNSAFNEWGPFMPADILHEIYYSGRDTDTDTGRLFFSSDREGNQDIYFCYYASSGESIPGELPRGINGLNTEYEEGYLCLHTDSLVNYETCYFTSNRDGNFDIFRATGEANIPIEISVTLTISKIEILSGVADDKCPYIINNMMVFTSNREGGQGGFDLWYSVYNNGSWSTPENFGPGINTEYDEYRPMIIPTRPELFLNDLLIFSSDRPGGMGGFDLYYTGMIKRIQSPD